MVQVASQSTFFSSSLSIASSSAEGRRGFLGAVMVGPQRNDDASNMGGFGREHNANSARSREALRMRAEARGAGGTEQKIRWRRRQTGITASRDRVRQALRR